MRKSELHDNVCVLALVGTALGAANEGAETGSEAKEGAGAAFQPTAN